MKLIVLIDNLPNPNMELLTEHGLSIYFETDDGLKWLLDTGASDGFALNAEKLGVNISDIDHLILSHAHSDHTGGLAEFLKRNDKADIYLSSGISGESYFSTRRGAKRDISIDYSVIEQNSGRFVYVDDDRQISSEVILVRRIPNIYPTPCGNRTLTTGDLTDDFDHEIALNVITPAGTVVISACSHHGILNTLKASGRKDIIAYIGGTHLLDSGSGNDYESDEELARIARQIESDYPNMQIFTGHCTGQNACRIFSDILRDGFNVFYSGFSLEF